jgi:hypothetical protein
VIRLAVGNEQTSEDDLQRAWTALRKAASMTVRRASQ